MCCVSLMLCRIVDEFRRLPFWKSRNGIILVWLFFAVIVNAIIVTHLSARLTGSFTTAPFDTAQEFVDSDSIPPKGVNTFEPLGQL